MPPELLSQVATYLVESHDKVNVPDREHKFFRRYTGQEEENELQHELSALCSKIVFSPD